MTTPSATGESAGAANLDSTYLIDQPDSMEEIPTIDMEPYRLGVRGACEQIADQLRVTTETVGFFYLKGHGISEELIGRTFAESRRFHELALEVKKAIPLVNDGVLRTGYQPPSEQHRPGANINIIADAKPNLYSFFSMNREPPTKNFWPEGLPAFRETLQEYHSNMEALARKFLPLWATSLDLPLDFFEQYFEEPQLTVSLLHYPPQKEIGNRQYGIAPHADSPLMTFLAQTGTPSLAVQMPSGHWRLVDVIPGTLLVNTGHTMVRWTNDRYLSTKHRVINAGDVDRYSIAAFFGPNANAMIECLPTCQGPDRPARYPPMSYAELRKWYYEGNG